jgi:hypothetical protein
MGSACVGLLGALMLASAAGTGVRDAERLLAESQSALAREPQLAWVRAREAVQASAIFVASDFVRPGRKDEILEEQFLAARGTYRRHRALVYEGAGVSLARLSRHAAAARYLHRAVELGREEARPALMHALAASGREWEALSIGLRRAGTGSLSAQETAECSVIADALGLASLQAEIDRARIAVQRVEPALGFIDGPFELPERARLSTGAPFRLKGEERPTLIYVAEASCRTCTADLEALARLAPAEARIVVAPARDGGDQALRQALALYRHDWPVVMGIDAGEVLRVTAPCLLYVGRQGWSGGVAQPALARTLPPLLALFGRQDVGETLPRGSWSHVRPRRPVLPLPPPLREGGLAPGEDEPFPGEFVRVAQAYAAGRFADALSALDVLAAGDQAWLLPPELRLDQALCLARLGRVDVARGLLRGIGDSRFQDDVDRALERLGRAPARR